MLRLFILLFLGIFMHGNDVANFVFTMEDNKLVVTAELESSEIKKALNTELNNITASELEAYFFSNISCEINGEGAEFALDTFVVDHHHLDAKFIFRSEYEQIETIKMKNTTLFEVNSKQSNVVKIRFNDQMRDFLINSKAPELTITL